MAGEKQFSIPPIAFWALRALRNPKAWLAISHKGVVVSDGYVLVRIPCHTGWEGKPRMIRAAWIPELGSLTKTMSSQVVPPVTGELHEDGKVTLSYPPLGALNGGNPIPTEEPPSLRALFMLETEFRVILTLSRLKKLLALLEAVAETERGEDDLVLEFASPTAPVYFSALGSRTFLRMPIDGFIMPLVQPHVDLPELAKADPWEAIWDPHGEEA